MYIFQEPNKNKYNCIRMDTVVLNRPLRGRIPKQPSCSRIHQKYPSSQFPFWKPFLERRIERLSSLNERFEWNHFKYTDLQPGYII